MKTSCICKPTHAKDLRARGIPVDDKMVLPADIFTDRATRRVRLGLLIADIVKKNELQATPEQVQAHVESIANEHEDPQGFIKWYMTDKERKAQIEAITMEDNVVRLGTQKARKYPPKKWLLKNWWTHSSNWALNIQQKAMRKCRFFITTHNIGAYTKKFYGKTPAFKNVMT